MKWYYFLLCWLIIAASAIVIVIAVIDLVLLNTGHNTILFTHSKF